MAIQAEDTAGKMLSAYFPVMLFVLCGFEHSIANMYFIPLGIRFVGVAGMIHNLVPVTAGNILGGAGFALMEYAVNKKQITDSKRKKIKYNIG